MKKKIVICNAHWSNRGDEAAIRVYCDWLLRHRKDWQYHIIFKDGKPVCQFPYETAGITRHSSKYLPSNIFTLLLCVITCGRVGGDTQMKRDVQEYRNADAIIYAPGGAVISDRFWWRKQLEYLLPFFAARCYRIPLYVAAPSMGPYDVKRRWRNFVRRGLLSGAEYLCVREDFSRKYMREIGIKKDIEVTVDSAFYEDTMPGTQSLSLDGELGLFFREHIKVVGMTVTDFSWHVEHHKKGLGEDIRSEMHQLIRTLLAEEYGVLLIPQLFGNQKDVEILEEFKEEHVMILDENYDTYFQQYVVSACYAVIGMRYHSNIFAAKAAVPFIAIAYEEKMLGFMEASGLQEWCVSLEDFSSQNVLERFRQLVRNYGSYRGILEEKRVGWKKRAEKNIELLEEFLNML